MRIGRLKKSIFLVFVMVIIFIFQSSCTVKKEAKLPQLIIGSDDYEPYNYVDADGEPAGLDVELAKEACARMGYEPVFRRINWSERDTALKNGEVDCLWSCYSIDGQEDKYAWVGPYMHSRQVVAVLKDSPLYTLDDLEGKRVAVRGGSKAESLFLKRDDDNIPKVDKVYTQSRNDEVATALRNGYVDAVAGYAATIRGALQNEGVDFRFLNEDLSHAALGIAFSKDSDVTVRIALSATLKDMLDDGTTERILKHYGVEIDKALGGFANE